MLVRQGSITGKNDAGIRSFVMDLRELSEWCCFVILCLCSVKCNVLLVFFNFIFVYYLVTT